VPTFDGGDDFSSSLVQRMGFKYPLALTRRRLKAPCNVTKEWNTPRFRRRLVNEAKQPSTALIDEAEVGVKWEVKRGRGACH
jgi:hypothetical protein